MDLGRYVSIRAGTRRGREWTSDSSHAVKLSSKSMPAKVTVKDGKYRI
jgi:hypothetical protein